MLNNISGPDLTTLKVFQAVSLAGGFTAAESVLGLTQPTISAQIRNLEVRLGFKVCERGRSGFKLTDRGQALLQRYVGLADEMRLFCQDVSSMNNRLVGDLRLGLIDNTVHTEANVVPDVLRRFSRRQQDVHIRITVGGPKRLEAGLLNNSIDIAIGVFPNQIPKANYVKLFTERQAIFCGKGHQFFGVNERNIREADLRSATWIETDFDENSTYGSQSSPRLANVTTSNQEAIAQTILAGDHLGFLPSLYGRIWVERGEMWEIQKRSFAYSADFSAAFLSKRKDNPIFSTFLEDLKSVIC